MVESTIAPGGRWRWNLGLAALWVTLGWGPGSAELTAQQEAPRPLDHDVYEEWRTIGQRAISSDGRWVFYVLERENNDGELVVREVGSEREIRIPRGRDAAFTRDGARIVARVTPETRGDDQPDPDTTPRDSLAIVDLAAASTQRIARVRSHHLPPESADWLVVHHHPEEDAEDDDGTLTLRSLSTGEVVEFADVHSFALSPASDLLVVVNAVRGTEDDSRSRVRAVVPERRTGSENGVSTIFEGGGTVTQLSVDAQGTQVAFLHHPSAETTSTPEEEPGPARDEAEPVSPESAEGEEAPPQLHHWTRDDPESRIVVHGGVEGIPEDWAVSPYGTVEFSGRGRRLLFRTAPRPTASPEVGSDLPLDDDVDVEIWHWEDDHLMSVQNVRREQERRRSYQALLLLDEDRVVQLADEQLPDVRIPLEGDADRAIGVNPGPYALESSWESPNPEDIYLVDVRSGERERLVQGALGAASISPREGFVSWYEPADSAWFVRDLESGRTMDVSSELGVPVYNERHDLPTVAGSYGTAGWLEDEGAFLIYDRFDLWAVDPRGETAPRSLTRGEGRRAGVQLRMVDLEDRSELPTEGPMLLSAFNEMSKDAGFYRGDLAGDAAPTPLVMEPRRFSTPEQARDAGRLLFTQQSFRDFPDLWVSDEELTDRTRVSRANPQQEEYRWGSAELVEWISTDGIPLQGVLMKPDDFDPGRRYPMVVYFYERWSDGLHNHYAPVPHRSTINFPMYTSHDYLVFIPDIVYRTGYPGESALNAVVPGVHHLLQKGFVDPNRIGLQGHSWGGYQIAFIVTRSQGLFRAGAAGAPVANMTSAYGGIRWQTGLSRQFQYERTQSRLGGTLWDMPLRYLENSPVFWADKIETPLLIMHNDADGAVPWEQGIELFVALRRLGKPAWLVNYRGEPHWPTSFANRRDWNIRMKQFFDHFLKDTAPPRWLHEGIPALERGRTLGYEAVDPGERP